MAATLRPPPNVKLSRRAGCNRYTPGNRLPPARSAAAPGYFSWPRWWRAGACRQL